MHTNASHLLNQQGPIVWSDVRKGYGEEHVRYNTWLSFFPGWTASGCQQYSVCVCVCVCVCGGAKNGKFDQFKQQSMRYHLCLQPKQCWICYLNNINCKVWAIITMQLVQTPPIKTTAVNTLLVGYEENYNCISGFCAARHKRDRTTWKLNIEKVIRMNIWVNTQFLFKCLGSVRLI